MDARFGNKDDKKETSDEAKNLQDEEGGKMDKNQLLSIQAKNRVNNWAVNTLEDMKMLTGVHDGLVAKYNVSKHEFRDRTKLHEISKTPMGPKKYEL